MPQGETIRYVRNSEIDKTLWNECIDNAANGLIYSYSIYLDCMAGNWDALILNNYEAVMPLPWRKKFGIYYLYQPFFVAQLGLFGNNITGELLAKFFDAIPSKFKYWDLSLNHKNLFALNKFNLFERMNYVLSLAQPYEELYKNYRENIRRNIKKSVQYGCALRQNIDVNEIISLAKEYSPKLPDNDYDNFSLLYQKLNTIEKAKTYGVYSKQNELLSSAVFLFSHNRAYYILVGNHPNGRTLGTSHTLIDAFIKEHAGKNLLLDFEGSDVRNLAFFYSSFGAIEEKYAAIKLNRLPFYLKWLKK